ncbi:hypothetical protein HOP50_01g04990 [Chloropicon primus]|uniref:Uncharacterized protein n=2 Tax=Chloropicon primus TaxID=1764295 RepID=A0A5B8MC88_9CHLO|nr:hypothetical protein A3770_01p05110 [Chloropicon primus]UPQ97208.1 hypothetical protein HOP50_01g04990 [Chloropicon primus]|eukprot:QDZ17993.1 hypothetical protein A3770_01p05110 [Chloropicon primus]
MATIAGKCPAHGYYVLSSGELEYERLKALRETRVQRILQVREQGRTLAKERRELLSTNTDRFEGENVNHEKENWMNERAYNVDYMRRMYEQLKLNVGKGHKKARSVSAKAKRRAAKQERYNEKIALATEERYNAAVEAVNRKRAEYGASLDDFKERRARVKEIEATRAKEGIARYFGSKAQREEEVKAKEEELLRLLGQGSGSYSTSHLHELGIPVEIRKHGDSEEGDDANDRALAINKMLKEREERNKKERAKALLRESERTHAAAQFVRAREMGRQVNKKLSNLWLKDREEKINEFLQHQKRRVARKEMSKTEKLEREIEDIFNLKPQEDQEVQYATAEEVQVLNWSNTLPKGDQRRSLAKELQAAKSQTVVRDTTGGAAAPSTSKAKPPINISIPKGLKKSNAKRTESTTVSKEEKPQTVGRRRPASAAAPLGRRQDVKPKPKRKGKGKGTASDRDPRLGTKGLKGVESYLDEKDPLNLQQLADDISLLTSSVLTDATELAKEDERRFMKDTQDLFSETSELLFGEQKVYDGSVPSTSENSSDPSFLNVGGSGLDFPELREIDNLLSDSFFSLSTLEEESNKGTESKSSKSSPFTLQSDELLEGISKKGEDDQKVEQSLFSPSSSSSSVLGGNESKASREAETLTSTLLDTSDDDLIDNFLERFEE